MTDPITAKISLGLLLLTSTSASLPEAESLGVWGFVIEKGFIAACLVGLAAHTVKERDKDRKDRKDRELEEREERCKDRKQIDEVLARKDDQIQKLVEGIMNGHTHKSKSGE